MDAQALASHLASYLLCDARDDNEQRFGRDGEFPSAADVATWDRLASSAARMARELKIPLEGSDYDRRCPLHPDDFVMRSVASVWPGRVKTFTCGCQSFPQFSGAPRHVTASYRYNTSS